MVLEVLAALVALGVKVPTALVARVGCMLVTVEVRPILQVAGCFGPSEVSNGGCGGTPPLQGSVCRSLTPTSCPWQSDRGWKSAQTYWGQLEDRPTGRVP